MAIPRVRIEAERLSQDSEVSLENTTGFTVENQGDTKVWLSFAGSALGRTIEVAPGSDRVFSGITGAIFTGGIIIEFDASEIPAGANPLNTCLIIRQIITNNC